MHFTLLTDAHQCHSSLTSQPSICFFFSQGPHYCRLVVVPFVSSNAFKSHWLCFQMLPLIVGTMLVALTTSQSPSNQTAAEASATTTLPDASDGWISNSSSGGSTEAPTTAVRRQFSRVFFSKAFLINCLFG